MKLDHKPDAIKAKTDHPSKPLLKILDEKEKAIPEYAGENKAAETNLKTQVGGDHYTKMGDYQPWIVLSKWLTDEELKGGMKCVSIPYLAREKDKGGREDIKKAYHTIGIYLELTKHLDERG